MNAKTWGIMCGTPLPLERLRGFQKGVAWLQWVFAMIGHLLVRCAILPGDISAHDLHHRKAGQYDWRISIYERQKAIDFGGKSAEIYRDVWGFYNALVLVFSSYEENQPLPIGMLSTGQNEKDFHVSKTASGRPRPMPSHLS